MKMKFINPHANRAISHRLPLLGRKSGSREREGGRERVRERAGIRIMAQGVNLARYRNISLPPCLPTSAQFGLERASSNVKELEEEGGNDGLLFSLSQFKA